MDREVAMGEFLSDYFVALTCTFVLIAMFPMAGFVVNKGREVWQQGPGSDA